LKHIKNNNILRNLYFALIYPHLTYGINAWGLSNKSNLKVLKTQQKKIIRIISKADFNAPSLNLFKDLKILDIQSTIIQTILSSIYKSKKIERSQVKPILNFETIDHMDNTRRKKTNN